MMYEQQTQAPRKTGQVAIDQAREVMNWRGRRWVAGQNYDFYTVDTVNITSYTYTVN